MLVFDTLDNRKASKYSSYTKGVEEVWLLIYTEGGLRSVPSEIGEDARWAEYRFPFDRAFWFDSFPNGEITCLRKA